MLENGPIGFRVWVRRFLHPRDGAESGINPLVGTLPAAGEIDGGVNAERPIHFS